MIHSGSLHLHREWCLSHLTHHLVRIPGAWAIRASLSSISGQVHSERSFWHFAQNIGLFLAVIAGSLEHSALFAREELLDVGLGDVVHGEA